MGLLHQILKAINRQFLVTVLDPGLESFSWPPDRIFNNQVLFWLDSPTMICKVRAYWGGDGGEGVLSAELANASAGENSAHSCEYQWVSAKWSDVLAAKIMVAISSETFGGNWNFVFLLYQLEPDPREFWACRGAATLLSPPMPLFSCESHQWFRDWDSY